METKLLETRRKAKAKKPEFIMQDYHKRKELKRRWRRPRGLHSKMRMRKAGHPKHVEIGYGSPRLVRHLDRKGMKRIVISNPQEVLKLNKETEAAVIKHGVGLQKKLQIIKNANQKGIRVINATEEKLNIIIESRNKNKAAKKELKKGSEKAKEPQKQKEKAEKEESTEEARAEEEKKEKDRLLTKREI